MRNIPKFLQHLTIWRVDDGNMVYPVTPECNEWTELHEKRKAKGEAMGRFQQIRCKQCGRLFMPRKATNVYCSNQCYVKGQREIQRKRYQERIAREKLTAVID